MRFKWLVSGLLFALIVSVCIAAAPAGLGTVGGQVVDAHGAPVADAFVTLQSSEGGHLQSAQTNTEGRFWFASLPEGQYSVRASDHGRVSEWRQNVWVSPGRQTNVTLHLRAKKGAVQVQ
ncbi:MAG TPA: carboxypeptidase-like regulatory domain-containing protein [Candidatus Acidoferrales bacterium]|nr:carboxypeptidase-like regulatory domain-containing protein [Candidatus Acidoferrales bacterium]